MEFAHRSVLLNECIDALAIKPDGIYLDGTLGGAGHSLQICRNLTTGRLIGVDRDLAPPPPPPPGGLTFFWARWRPKKRGCTATQKK